MAARKKTTHRKMHHKKGSTHRKRRTHKKAPHGWGHWWKWMTSM